MASIQEHLDKIKNAIFGKDVRQAIHDSIKQCYDDAAVNHDNANMEVKLARGSHNTLNDRLVENEKNQEKISSQLEHKANSNEVIKKGNVNLNDCTEEMLTAIQNKEGETNFNLLSIPRDNSVTVTKLENALQEKIIKIEDLLDNNTISIINATGSTTYEVNNKTITANVGGNGYIQLNSVTLGLITGKKYKFNISYESNVKLNIYKMSSYAYKGEPLLILDPTKTFGSFEWICENGMNLAINAISATNYTVTLTIIDITNINDEIKNTVNLDTITKTNIFVTADILNDKEIKENMNKSFINIKNNMDNSSLEVYQKPGTSCTIEKNNISGSIGATGYLMIYTSSIGVTTTNKCVVKITGSVINNIDIYEMEDYVFTNQITTYRTSNSELWFIWEKPNDNTMLSIYSELDNSVNLKMDVYDVTDLTDEVIESIDFSILDKTTTILLADLSKKSEKSTESEWSNKNKSRWYGKKWYVCGDSITNNRKYQPLVAEKLGMSYTTDGNPGQDVAGCTSKLLANPSLLDDYDLFTLYASTNDFGGNKELGNIDSDFNTETTYGSFKLAIKTILTHKPTIKIILFTPTPRGKFENQPNYGESNSKGYKLIDYVNCVKEVGEFYNLKVLDLYHLSGFNQFTIDAFTTDKLHHNDLGTEQIVPLIVDCISNS